MAKQFSLAKKAPTYKCGFCNKEYKREDTILTHKCEKRERYNQRDSREMREAFRLYMEFMTKHRLSIGKKEEPLMHFIKSKYFNEFYKFAEYILENDILEKEKFVNEILTSGKPVYEWMTHKTLEEWIIKCLREEHPRRAIERSIPALVEWAEITESDWTNFFQEVSPVRAIQWLECGKISPWLIFISRPESGNALLSRLSPSELDYVVRFIDPTFYQRKQLKYSRDCDEIRTMLNEAGL